MSRKANSAATLTQDTILAAAALRRYGHVLPLPDDVDAASAKASKLLKAMLAGGLVEEHPTSSAKAAWRLGEQGGHVLLRITQAGRQSISPAPAAKPGLASPSIPDVAGQASAEGPRMPGGKLGRVLAAVRSAHGASLNDLIALTGWQPHTVRASLTRLRQGGVPIQLTQQGGEKRYSAEAARAG